MAVDGRKRDGLASLILKSDSVRVLLVSAAGVGMARLVSMFERELMCTRPGRPIEREKPGSNRDVVFWDAIDELLQKDVRESSAVLDASLWGESQANTDSSISPNDCGELWTASLSWQVLSGSRMKFRQ